LLWGKGLVILQKRVAGLSAASLARFVLRARRAARLHGRVNVLITGSTTIQSLNHRFLGTNKATDVLSFPDSPVSPARRNGVNLAGEIAISADVAAHNAAQLGHTSALEVKILTLHGILHLAGFDHERDNGEMARKESALRRKLGLPTALIERVRQANKKSLHSREGIARAARRSTA
jgi:probable rRNA maturation factor